MFIFDHVKAGQAAGHRQVVATEGGGVSDATVEAREDALINRAAHDDGGAGDVTAGEGFGEGDDIRVKIPVLESEPFSGAAESGLNFVGDEKSPVLSAEFLSGREVVVGRIFDALALNGFKNKGGDIAGAKFGFEIGEIAKFNKTSAWQEGIEILAEIPGVSDGEGAEGQAVVRTFLGENLWTFRVGSGELEGAFHRFRAGVTKEAGIAWSEFFCEGFGQETGKNRAIHLDHVGEVEFEHVPDGFLNGGMIATDVEDAVATEEVEVVLSVEVVEVGSFAPSIDFVETDRPLNFDEGTVYVLVMQVVILTQPGEDRVFQVEISHGIQVNSYSIEARKWSDIFKLFQNIQKIKKTLIVSGLYDFKLDLLMETYSYT